MDSGELVRLAQRVTAIQQRIDRALKSRDALVRRADEANQRLEDLDRRVVEWRQALTRDLAKLQPIPPKDLA